MVQSYAFELALVDLGISIALEIFPSYYDLEAGDTQSLKFSSLFSSSRDTTVQNLDFTR